MKKIVIARIFIKNECIEAFKKKTAGLIQKTRKEKGCLFYGLFQDVSSPGEFLFYEEYANQDAMETHFKSEYLETFRISINSMQSKEKVVEII